MRRDGIRALILAAALLAALGVYGWVQEGTRAEVTQEAAPLASSKEGRRDMPKTDEEWKKVLTPEEFRVLRKKGTERAFTNEYHDHKEDGVYRCAGCGQPLFDSSQKFDSGSGWPSYWAPIQEGAVDTAPDYKLLMKRTEVLCSNCGGHLGHVFEDGPDPTGLRYCINSVALDFEEREAEGDGS